MLCMYAPTLIRTGNTKKTVTCVMIASTCYYVLAHRASKRTESALVGGFKVPPQPFQRRGQSLNCTATAGKLRALRSCMVMCNVYVHGTADPSLLSAGMQNLIQTKLQALTPIRKSTQPRSKQGKENEDPSLLSAGTQRNSFFFHRHVMHADSFTCVHGRLR